MYESEANFKESLNYNLFCHTCLSSNRTLCSVQICEHLCIKNLTSQVNVCWECMSLLKKAHAFQQKVEKAQRILDGCAQVPLEDNLSKLTVSSTETYDYDAILEDENADEYERYLEEPNMMNMIRIEDVRGGYDIMDLTTSSVDVTATTQLAPPEDEEERKYRQWRKGALHVYKRICSHRYAHHFLKPVSDELAPLYSRIVCRPTDLSAIKRWIKNGVIRTTAKLKRELQLMFSNALMYNSRDHEIYPMIMEFREETLRELSLLEEVQSETDCPSAPQLRRRRSERSASRRPSVRECSACSHPSVRERSASCHHSVRERSASRRPSVRKRAASCHPSVRERSASRRPSVRKRAASCHPSVRKRSASRRPSVRECRSPVSVPASSAGVVSLLSPAARVPHPLTRRRKSLWDASQEARECPSPVTPVALGGATSPPPALPSRCSTPASVLIPSTRRRKSLWDASPEDQIKARRPRRKSACQPKPAAPRAKRRAKWDWNWTCLDDEYLVPSCFKKYTSDVLL